MSAAAIMHTVEKTKKYPISNWNAPYLTNDPLEFQFC